MDQDDPSSGRGSNTCKITRRRLDFNGIGEPLTTSSTAAVRNATGLPLPRIPIRPADIALRGDRIITTARRLNKPNLSILR